MNFIMEPPPSAIDKLSGILKLVLTPPILTYEDANLGNPLISYDTSVLVPPISITTAFYIPVNIYAPLREFVGPLENVYTGYFNAYSHVNSVPSLCVKYILLRQLFNYIALIAF